MTEEPKNNDTDAQIEQTDSSEASQKKLVFYTAKYLRVLPLRYIVTFVALIHILVIFIRPDWFIKPSTIEINNEDVFEIDFEEDGPMNFAKKSDQKKNKDEIPVENILPQLPKSFEVKKPDPKQEAADPEPKKEKDEKEKKKKKEDKKEPAKPKKDKKPTPATKPEDKNKKQIEKDELLKRAALDRLRKQVKDKKKSNLSPKLADLDALKNKGSGKNSTGGRHNSIGRAKMIQSCQRDIIKLMKIYYKVPEFYSKDVQVEKVKILLVLNNQGNIKKSGIIDSSGDPSLDQIALSALQKSAPFPDSCRELSGKQININFSI